MSKSHKNTGLENMVMSLMRYELYKGILLAHNGVSRNLSGSRPMVLEEMYELYVDNCRYIARYE